MTWWREHSIRSIEAGGGGNDQPLLADRGNRRRWHAHDYWRCSQQHPDASGDFGTRARGQKDVIDDALTVATATCSLSSGRQVDDLVKSIVDGPHAKFGR